MKNHTNFFVLLFIFIFSIVPISDVFAQNNFSISGKVLSNGIEVPGAAILLSGYKATTITSGEGDFSIKNLQPGKYDLIVKMLGFKPTSQSIEITDKNILTTIHLEESTTTLNEVVIGPNKPDDNREFNMRTFKNLFIGLSENAKSCKIINPEVISFYFNQKERTLHATASDILIIENKALGYRINYLLKDFEVNFSSQISFYAGLPHFEPLKARPAQLKKYNNNRKEAYLGSINHFYKSLYNGISNKEGYLTFKRKEVLNPDRQPDSIIKVKIEQFSNHAFANVKSSVFTINDSLNYWIKEKRKPEFINLLDSKQLNVDSLVSVHNDDLKELAFKDDLLVVYEKEKESTLYNSYELSIPRHPKYKGMQVSVIRMLMDNIRFYPDGLLYDYRSTLNLGYWAFEKIADLVPLDENFD